MERPVTMGLILGSLLIVFGYIRLICLNILSKRQSRTIRQTLFRSILEKNIAFFDEHKTGELNYHLTDNVNRIQDGLGEKFGMAIELLSNSICCFVVGKYLFRFHLENQIFVLLGFSEGWKLALVILSLSPVIFGAVAILFKV